MRKRSGRNYSVGAVIGGSAYGSHVRTGWRSTGGSGFASELDEAKGRELSVPVESSSGSRRTRERPQVPG